MVGMGDCLLHATHHPFRAECVDYCVAFIYAALARGKEIPEALELLALAYERAALAEVLSERPGL